MDIKEAVEKSGTYNILNKGAIKKAQQMIQQNENILYAAITNVMIEDNRNTIMSQSGSVKGLLSATNMLSGVIVVTNKRVLFCNSIMGNVNQKQIRIQDITSVDKNINGLTKMGQLRIRGITEAFTINIYKEKIAIGIENNVQKAQELLQGENEKEVRTVSIADEILKFKKLLDDGIITQEEFERKKQDLLK